MQKSSSQCIFPYILFPNLLFLTKLNDKFFCCFLSNACQKILDLCELHQENFCVWPQNQNCHKPVQKQSFNTISMQQSSTHPLLRQKTLFLISQKEGRPRGCTYKSRIFSSAVISYFLPWQKRIKPCTMKTQTPTRRTLVFHTLPHLFGIPDIKKESICTPICKIRAKIKQYPEPQNFTA